MVDPPFSFIVLDPTLSVTAGAGSSSRIVTVFCWTASSVALVTELISIITVSSDSSNASFIAVSVMEPDRLPAAIVIIAPRV